MIRDKRTGDSLQYAFIEYEHQKDCEQAYFKMQGVLIDDHRIHVDFSQSVGLPGRISTHRSSAETKYRSRNYPTIGEWRLQPSVDNEVVALVASLVSRRSDNTKPWMVMARTHEDIVWSLTSKMYIGEGYEPTTIMPTLEDDHGAKAPQRPAKTMMTGRVTEEWRSVANGREAPSGMERTAVFSMTGARGHRGLAFFALSGHARSTEVGRETVSPAMGLR